MAFTKPAAAEDMVKKNNCGLFGEGWTSSFLLAGNEVGRPDTPIVTAASDDVCLVMR